MRSRARLGNFLPIVCEPPETYATPRVTPRTSALPTPRFVYVRARGPFVGLPLRESAVRVRPRLGCRLLGRCVWRLLVAPALAGDPQQLDFRRDVLPILSQNCFTCHGPDSKTRKADLRLDQKEVRLRPKEPVIVPGKSGESELVAASRARDPDEVMPPPRRARS